VDYNDHFETPRIAYEDIAPLLDWLALGRPRKEHIIYDPYYCNGQTSTIFHQLGFDGIINRKRDFYQDILDDNLPDFQTLVTNPPYSDQHKDRCLEFCFQQLRKEEQRKPFFLLMPNYVASREYYRRRIGVQQQTQEGHNIDEDIVYLIPSVPYEYDHPEGTGKEVSPFASLWFCGMGKEKAKQAKEYWESIEWKHDRPKPRLAISLEELKNLNAIPTQKRPNPRQRKKKRQHAQSDSATNQQISHSDSGHSGKKKRRVDLLTKQYHQNQSDVAKCNASAPKSKSKSKYRNGEGKRKKERF